MKKIIFALLIIGALTGCYKSDIYVTETPDMGTVSLTATWENLHDGEEKPDRYTFHIGEESHDVEGESQTFVVDPHESQLLYVHNNPTGISIVNGLATLSAASRAVADPEPKPQSLYYARHTMDILQDRVNEITLNTQRGTAYLSFNLQYTSSEVSNVESVKVELSGIAGARNILTDELSDVVTLTHYPTLSATESAMPVVFNVLGTIGDTQELKITITDVNGGVKVITSNISADLKDFNTDMKPLIFTNPIELPMDVESGDISINGWVVGEGILGEILEPTI